MKASKAQLKANTKWRQGNKQHVNTYSKIWRNTNLASYIYNATKSRALRNNIEFTIQLSDVVVPTHCPYLGIPLIPGEGSIQDTSPLLDRIDNSKGYVKGNVEVVSYLANRAKSNMSVEQLKLFAKTILEKYAKNIT